MQTQLITTTSTSPAQPSMMFSVSRILAALVFIISQGKQQNTVTGYFVQIFTENIYFHEAAVAAESSMNSAGRSGDTDSRVRSWL